VKDDLDGTFAVISKAAKLPDTDDWSMADHGPDNNRFSNDKLHNNRQSHKNRLYCRTRNYNRNCLC